MPGTPGHIQYFATSYSKAPTTRAGQPFAWTAWKCCGATTTPILRMCGRNSHLRSTTMKDCDSTKEAINLSHALALEQGTFDQKVFYEAFGIFDNPEHREKPCQQESSCPHLCPSGPQGWESAACLLWRNPWSRSWTGCRAFYVIRMQAEGLMEKRIISLGGISMSQIRILLSSQRRPAAGELSGGDCSGAVYMAIWDWCEASWIWMSVFPLPRRRTPWTALCWRESWRLNCWQLCGSRTSWG